MIDSMTLYQLSAGALVLVIAYIVRGIAGFGSGLIAIPVLTLMLPISIVVPLVVLLDYLASLSQGLKNREDIRWKELLPLIPFSLAGVVVALFFLTKSDALILTKALGVFIILYAFYTLSGYTPKSGASKGWGVLAGFSGGLIGTLFGTGGPLYVTYFKARGLEKTAFRTTMAVTFLMDGAGRLVGYASTGFFNKDFFILIAATLPVMAVSLYIGGHVHTKVTQLQFQRGISVLLILSGSVLLLK